MKKIITMMAVSVIGYSSQAQDLGYAIGLQARPYLYSSYYYNYYPEPVVNVDNNITIVNAPAASAKEEFHRSVNLMGLSKKDVIKYISKTGIESKSMINGRLDTLDIEYVSFWDNKNFFGYYFDNNSICYAYRVAYEYSAYNNVMKTLNELYTKTSDTTWEKYVKGGSIICDLTEEDKHFMIDVYKKK